MVWGEHKHAHYSGIIHVYNNNDWSMSVCLRPGPRGLHEAPGTSLSTKKLVNFNVLSNCFWPSVPIIFSDECLLLFLAPCTRLFPGGEQEDDHTRDYQWHIEIVTGGREDTQYY